MTLTLPETTLLEQLLQSPRLPAVAQHLDALVADEATRRARFIATVLETEKAEFINGEKIVQSPAKLKHTATVGKLLHLISTYVMVHGLGWVGFEKVMVSLTRNDYEPDICFFAAATADGFHPDQMRFPAPDFVVEVQPDALLRIDERCGGQSRVTDDGFIEGAPELVVEISGSTVSYDLHAKLNIYRRAGVREYVVWRVYDGAVDWFLLEEGRYVAQTLDAQGCYHSQVFPGLILPAPALLAGALAQVLGAVQQGVQTPEHRAFVQQLLDRTA